MTLAGKTTARSRVLWALQKAGRRGCTTADLASPMVGGVRFGARLKELRDEGWMIVCTPLRPGSHHYQLLTDVEREPVYPDDWTDPKTGHIVLDYTNGHHGEALFMRPTIERKAA